MISIIVIPLLLVGVYCDQSTTVDDSSARPLEHALKETIPLNNSANKHDDVNKLLTKDDIPASEPNSETDLDTDATFWGWGGWGYRRPYYSVRRYYSPWRSWGYGRGYGGYGYGRGYGGWGRRYYWG